VGMEGNAAEAPLLSVARQNLHCLATEWVRY
jgi:hypothetical protein